MFERTTNHLYSSAGRAFEITIGAVVALIAVMFWWLLWMAVSNASMSYSLVIGGFVLAIVAYWFSHLGYRLIFNKPRKGGGLFAPWVLKGWLILLGASSVLISILAFINYEFSLALSTGSMALIIGAVLLGLRERNHVQS